MGSLGLFSYLNPLLSVTIGHGDQLYYLDSYKK